MSFALRQFRQDTVRACVVVEKFKELTPAETMARISDIVRWYEAGKGIPQAVYAEPEDALVSIAMWMQRSEAFGEPVPPPRASEELREQFESRVASYASADE